MELFMCHSNSKSTHSRSLDYIFDNIIALFFRCVSECFVWSAVLLTDELCCIQVHRFFAKNTVKKKCSEVSVRRKIAPRKGYLKTLSFNKGPFLHALAYRSSGTPLVRYP